MATRPAWRFIAGMTWAISSFFAWVSLCASVGSGLAYLVNERGVRLPDWTPNALTMVSVAGLIVIPPFVAILAKRGKLAGTGESGYRGHRGRGFEVIPLTKSEDNRESG